jgi:hypothetical protein
MLLGGATQFLIYFSISVEGCGQSTVYIGASGEISLRSCPFGRVLADRNLGSIDFYTTSFLDLLLQKSSRKIWLKGTETEMHFYLARTCQGDLLFFFGISSSLKLFRKSG